MAKNRAHIIIAGSAKGALKAIKRVVAGIKGVGSSVLSIKSIVVGAVAGGGIAMLGKSFIDAARTSENYRIRLNHLLGSQKEGNRLFAAMADYAGRVPFAYDQVMGSATQLAGILKGGVKEIKQWMPLIGDLAAVAGMGIQEATEQVSRMLSAGAASADMFRERGILAMLGFTSGVSYSVEETRKKLMEAWKDPKSKFKDATKDMASTWDGLISMLGDAWFSFRNAVMDSGVFDYLKNTLKTIIDNVNTLKQNGKFEETAKKVGDLVFGIAKLLVGAVPKGLLLILEVISKIVMITQGWSLLWSELKIHALGFGASAQNILRFIAEGFRQIFTWTNVGGIFDGAIAGLQEFVDAQDQVIAYMNKERTAEINVQAKKIADMEKPQADIDKYKKTVAELEEQFKNLTTAQKTAATESASATKQSTDAQISDLERLIEKYNELNAVKLKGTGKISVVPSLDHLADEIDKGSDT